MGKISRLQSTDCFSVFGNLAIPLALGPMALRPPITRGLPLSDGDLSGCQIQVDVYHDFQQSNNLLSHDYQ